MEGGCPSSDHIDQTRWGTKVRSEHNGTLQEHYSNALTDKIYGSLHREQILENIHRLFVLTTIEQMPWMSWSFVET